MINPVFLTRRPWIDWCKDKHWYHDGMTLLGDLADISELVYGISTQCVAGAPRVSAGYFARIRASLTEVFVSSAIGDACRQCNC